ncbi:hypothetical protein [Novipirellula galeiformis]|uniref:hypothetical protein n=1 Tax=Novipirellula galeiformis TaxID=2528004 RepID=UPI0011B8179F|nr:hypothetical protein [Novipirellula galeiformis]
MEAFPQDTKISLSRTERESEAVFTPRRDQNLDRHFIGAAAMSQAACPKEFCRTKYWSRVNPAATLYGI